MTPQEWQQVRRVARAEAQRALASGAGGGLPSVWTGEVQVYNAALAEQGVRTLRGLAAVVSDLQAPRVDPALPQGEERAFGFEEGRLVSVQHGTALGSDAAVLVRQTALHYDEDGRLESVEDTWEHEGEVWGRAVVLSYDEEGAVALVVRRGPCPLDVFLCPMSVSDEEVQ